MIKMILLMIQTIEKTNPNMGSLKSYHKDFDDDNHYDDNGDQDDFAEPEKYLSMCCLTHLHSLYLPSHKPTQLSLKFFFGIKFF